MKDKFYNLQNKHLQIKFWVVSSWLDRLKKNKNWRPKKKRQQSERSALNQSRLWLSLSWAAFNFSSSVLAPETHGSRLETSSLVIHPNSRLKYVGCFYHLQRGDATRWHVAWATRKTKNNMCMKTFQEWSYRISASPCIKETKCYAGLKATNYDGNLHNGRMTYYIYRMQTDL